MRTRLLLAPLLFLAGCRMACAQDAPPADEKPLPAPDALLKAVEANEDRDEAILKQYTYHVHDVHDDFDGDEAVKKSHVTDSESIPTNGVRVDRVVARDGVPLTPDEAKKENERFDKEVAKAQKRKAEEARDDQKLTVARMLELGDFTNERRVILNGRPAIVLDYAGKHDAKTRTQLEKIFEDLAGTVWIDEQDKVIARMEGHFAEDYKIGFGLVADIHKGMTFQFEQVKVHDEVWLPKAYTGQGKASLFVVLFRVHGRVQATFSDYRKYHANVKLMPGETVVDDNGAAVNDNGSATPESPQPPAPAPKP